MVTLMILLAFTSKGIGKKNQVHHFSEQYRDYISFSETHEGKTALY